MRRVLVALATVVVACALVWHAHREQQRIAHALRALHAAGWPTRVPAADADADAERDACCTHALAAALQHVTRSAADAQRVLSSECVSTASLACRWRALALRAHAGDLVADWESASAARTQLDAEWRAHMRGFDAAQRSTLAHSGLVLAQHAIARVERPARMRAIAESNTRLCVACAELAHALPAMPPPRGPRARLRLGVLSCTFGEHVVRYVLQSVLYEHLPRNRVHIACVDVGRAEAARPAVAEQCDEYIDARALASHAVAVRVRALALDVLLSFDGWIPCARPELMAVRLAPVQAIGFTSTTGMRGTVDLFVGDRVATPPDSAAAAFSERLVLLPRSYFVAAHREQFGDIERALPAAPVRAWLASWATAVADAAPAGNTTGTLPVAHARQAVRRALFAQAGLEHAAPAVACSFNQAYKVSPRAFDAWMRVLDAAPHAVLWLLEFPREASDRLRARAPVHLARRIVATPRLPLAQHVALKGACDLHLDGHPYGAHITAADALYAGVPVLTRTARTFSGRVASSLLVHADPSAAATLVCASWACFESRGARLLASAELPALRAQLAHAVRTSPRSLFAAPAYARDTYAWLAMAVDLRAARRTAGHFVVCS